MSQHSHENPDSPEIEIPEPSEQTPRKRRANVAPATLVDYTGAKFAADEAISESAAAKLIGMPPSTLSYHRSVGHLNPKLLLRNASPVARGAGAGVTVWWNRPLLQAILNSDTTEPFYVGGE